MFLQSQFDSYASRLRDHDIPVRLRLWNGVEAQLGSATKVTITVPTLSALRHLLSPSLYVLGQAYVEGEIDVDGRATDIVDVAARLAAFESGASTRGRDGAQIISHTRKMDAEAIAYHYDVSNEFYSLWLDRNMVYSCGYFRTREDSLESAQTQKIDHILTKLRVQPGDRLLDIGCGWGALMIRAAEKFGAKVVGITLSNNQFEYARERIAAAGLANHCEVHIEDYRDVTGTFDRIASVGMFEHVGLKNLRSYFAKIRELLADNGAAHESWHYLV
jgi:cyclopropane-fatty-acyl-phospholipid synthase